ncbi:hypothetical protein [Haloarchaeobius sp. TZWSO28]|uniref:hypothetical protein n=1 Tax=Haloarchaeobius sp. TZWSO28 TaxID=3446119 RepID=UPI003EBCB2D9
MQHNNSNNTIIRWGDERGVSPVLGGILIFGLALSLLALTQVSLVPAMNGQIEFEHNQQVQEDFEQLNAGILEVAEEGSPTDIVVQPGTRYPARMFLVNPGPASGRLDATTGNGIRISNIAAVDPDADEYLAGLATSRELSYSTSTIAYTPRYNNYGTAPTTYLENGIVYNRFPNGATTLVTDSAFIDGNRITLIAVDSDLSLQSVDSETLRLEPVTGATQRLAVTNSGGDLTIRLDTQLSQTEWDELLAEPLARGTVTDVDVSAGTVTITLKPGTYTLQVARVSIEKSTASEQPAYIVNKGGSDLYMTVGGSETLRVQVRDQYHTPVSGVVVNATDPGVGSLAENSAITDEDGIAEFTYAASVSNGSATINMSFGTAPTSVESTEVSIKVGERNEGIGGTINPGSANTVNLQMADITEVNTSNKMFYADLTLENRGSVDRTIDEVRVNFYSARQISNSNNRDPALEYRIDGTGPSGSAANFTIGGDYAAPASTLETIAKNGGTETFRFEFIGLEKSGSDTVLANYQIEEGDYFILSIIYDDGTSATYFVTPQVP